MQKIAKTDIEKNPEFVFAKNFLKEQVMGIASSFTGPEDMGVEERANNHYIMVAKIVKMYMTVLGSFAEHDLKELSNQKKNVQTLNRFLALRQLAETQLHGVLQGTWGLPPDVTGTVEFQEAIAKSDDVLTRSVVWSAVQN
jgi:hypothetical protein